MHIDEILDSGEKAQTTPLQEGWGLLAKAGTKLKNWGIAKRPNYGNPVPSATDARIKPRFKLKTPTKPVATQVTAPPTKDLEVNRMAERLRKLFKKDVKKDADHQTNIDFNNNELPTGVNKVGDALIKIGAGGTSLLAVNRYLEYLDSKENNNQ
jgi:hypothetical protein